VPNALIRARELKPELKMTLIYLRCMDWGSGGCRVSQHRIAAELGVDSRTVRRHLRQLIEQGLVSVDRSNACNRYFVNRSVYDEDKNAPSPALSAVKDAPAGEDKNAPDHSADLPPIQILCHEKTATSSCSEEVNTEVDEVRSALVAAGVNEPALSDLAQRVTMSDVQNQRAWMQYRRGIRNPAPALITALSENWTEPDEAKRQRQSDAVRQIEEQRAAAARGLVEAIGTVKCTVDDLWKLPSVERHMLGERARRELGGDAAARLYGDELFAEMCRKYSLYLLDQRRVS